jgi:long-chain acyl-CoA synthetase
MPNLANEFVEAARIYPDRTAVRQDDVVLTYANLDARTASVAGWLTANGVLPGDRVGVMLPNVADFAVVYYGVLRAGAVVVPINPLLRGREVEHYLSDSGARLIFAWHAAEGGAEAAAATGARVVTVGTGTPEYAGHAAAQTVERRAADDTAVILYTSGTTGTPKGAELTHENLRRNAALSATGLLGIDQDDVVVGCLPLFHSFGQTCALNATLASGACITLVPRFDPPTVLDVIERDGATVFAGVPTMYVALAGLGADPARTKTLKTCISGGAALPVEVLHSFEAAYRCLILEGYGLSETSPVASFNLRGKRREGSIGTPVEGVAMRVIDVDGNDMPSGEVGEIAIAGHNVMKGYWQRPDATAAAIVDGWFRTGDLGRQDEDGFFYIVDRKKDMIIRGGFNVYPREVEEVLYEHPDVIEAAVLGVPHPTHGEEVAAAVALRPGSSVSADELRAYVKERVAPYKYPRLVWFVDALPKGGTGKILKRAIVVPAEVH